MKKINSTTRKYHSFDRSAGTQQERLKVLSVCQNWPTKSISLKVEYNILKDWFYKVFKMAHSAFLLK